MFIIIQKETVLLPCFLAKYHKTKRELSYINAGHNASLIIQSGKVLSLSKGTIMIGAFDDLPFVNEGFVRVEKGAVVFNYTDGVLEYDGDEDKSLPEEELIAFLGENNNLELHDIHNKLIEKVETIRKSKIASDDITMLSLRFH